MKPRSFQKTDTSDDREIKMMIDSLKDVLTSVPYDFEYDNSEDDDDEEEYYD